MNFSLSWPQKIAKTVLGLFLTYAGLGHLFWARQEFLAQVPSWLPLEPDLVVVLSGYVEILLGLGLIFLSGSWGLWVGAATAAFFIAIFPGNINQYVNGINAFGLDTDRARLIRLFFQPLLVVWALWASGAWAQRKKLLGKIRPA